MKKYCWLLGLLLLGCCERGRDISILFSASPKLSERAPVFWNDIEIGEVRALKPGPNGNSVVLTARIRQDWLEHLDNRLVFYVETDLFGNPTGPELRAYKCEHREPRLPEHFEGYFGRWSAAGDCYYQAIKSMADDLFQSGKRYWNSPEGKADREKLSALLGQAKEKAGEGVEELKEFGKKIAEEMRKRGWDKDAEDFLEKLGEKIKELGKE